MGVGGAVVSRERAGRWVGGEEKAPAGFHGGGEEERVSGAAAEDSPDAASPAQRPDKRAASNHRPSGMGTLEHPYRIRARLCGNIQGRLAWVVDECSAPNPLVGSCRSACTPSARARKSSLWGRGLTSGRRVRRPPASRACAALSPRTASGGLGGLPHFAELKADSQNRLRRLSPSPRAFGRRPWPLRRNHVLLVNALIAAWTDLTPLYCMKMMYE